MTIGVRQTATNDDAGSGTTMAATFGSSVLSGSTLFAVVTKEIAGVVSGVSDTVNGAWTQLITLSDATNGQMVDLWAFKNSASGTPTVTATYSASETFRAIRIFEIEDAAADSFPSIVSNGQVHNAAGTDGLTTNNMKPPGAPGLIIGAAMATGTFPGNAASAGTGFTDHGSNWQFGFGGDYLRSESLRFTTSASRALTFTRNADALHTVLGAVFLENGATLDPVTWISSGGPAYSAASGASVAAPFPASIASGNALIAFVHQKPATANGGGCTTPTGWNLLGSITGAGGYGATLGADTGNTNLFVYTREAAGTESGTQTFNLSDNNVSAAIIHRLSKPSGNTWSFAMATGSDTSAGSVSITFGSDPGVIAGDVTLVAFGIPTDVTTPTQFSAEAITQTGVTYGTVTEVEEWDTTNGNDLGGVTCYATATAGTSSAAPVFTATAGGTTTNVRGPGVFVRVRSASSAVTGTVSAAISAFAATAVGLVTFASTGSATMAPFAVTGTGSTGNDIDGTASAATAPFAATSTGSEIFTGSAAASLPSFAVAATGANGISGTVNVAVASFAASSAGSEEFTGSAVVSTAAFGVAAIGVFAIPAPMPRAAPRFIGFPAKIVSPPKTLLGSGFLTPAQTADVVAGSASAEIASFGVSATGLVTFNSSGSVAIAPFAAVGSGEESFLGSGSADVPAFGVSSNVDEIFTGAASCAVAPFSVVVAGIETFISSAAVEVASFACTATGSEVFTGTCAVSVSSFAADGTAAVGDVITGSASCVLSSFGVVASGDEVFTSSCAAEISSFTSSSLGIESFNGSASIACQPFTVSATGATGTITVPGVANASASSQANAEGLVPAIGLAASIIDSSANALCAFICTAYSNNSVCSNALVILTNQANSSCSSNAYVGGTAVVPGTANAHGNAACSVDGQVLIVGVVNGIANSYSDANCNVTGLVVATNSCNSGINSNAYVQIAALAAGNAGIFSTAFVQLSCLSNSFSSATTKINVSSSVATSVAAYCSSAAQVGLTAAAQLYGATVSDAVCVGAAIVPYSAVSSSSANLIAKIIGESTAKVSSVAYCVGSVPISDAANAKAHSTATVVSVSIASGPCSSWHMSSAFCIGSVITPPSNIPILVEPVPEKVKIGLSVRLRAIKHRFVGIAVSKKKDS